MLGGLAIAMIVLPVLPTPVPMWIRLLLAYSVVPLAISAVVAGAVALRRMRGLADADRFRARSGAALGSMVIVILLGVIVWGIWALGQAHR